MSKEQPVFADKIYGVHWCVAFGVPFILLLFFATMILNELTTAH
jgi:hypothetical protein